MPYGSLRIIMARDLDLARRQILAYPGDELPWMPVGGIENPGGVLGLHLAGNLQHYVGALLGGTGYRRDREAEFARQEVPRTAIAGALEAAAQTVDEVLARAEKQGLPVVFPEPLRGRRVGTTDFLIHLAVHLGYHLGQLDYHRRMVAPESGPVAGMSLEALPEP